MKHLLLVVLAVQLISGCTENAELGPSPTPTEETSPPKLLVTSSAFEDGGDIPERYAYSGCGAVPVPLAPLAEEVSPPIKVEGLPPEAKSIALWMDDPDAPGGHFLHWRFWNLPVAHADLPEDADLQALGATEEENDWGQQGYGGPCPPSRHQYVFTVLAVSQDRVSNWNEAKKNALAEGQLVGYYG